MTMATTTTVRRDDAAECRAAFEKWIEVDKSWGIFEMFNRMLYLKQHYDALWISWQAAWKAAKGV